MPGCNECKFYKSEISFYSEKSIRTCSAGNTDIMLAWWEENGKKFDDLTDLPCHEHFESTKSLIEMDRLLGKMLKVVDHISYFK